ncbi:MAG: hypothetical protein SO441_05055 [Candidatus Limivicinus sp.]|nr:hypothetical protein [Candidatus Limivicinus sp.]
MSANGEAAAGNAEKALGGIISVFGVDAVAAAGNAAAAPMTGAYLLRCNKQGH